MSLSQTYRSQIATRQNRWLGFYLVLAAAVHVTGVIGLAIWHPKSWLNPQASKEQNPTPVEFVYVKPQAQTSPPPQTQRRAQANSAAGGNRNSQLTMQTGKAGVKSVPQPAQTSAPMSLTRMPRPSDAVSTPLNPRPALSPPTPDRSSTQSPQPTPLPSSTSAPLQPNVSPSPSPITPATSRSSPSAPQLGSLAARSIDLEGQGLDGTFNPDRNGAGFGVDAAQDNLWGPYLSRLNQAIDQQWQRVSVAATRRTKIQFRVDRQGQLMDSPDLLQSSGDILADQAALRAVQAAAPFAPLPQNVPEDVLIVNFTFTQSLSSP